MNIENIKIEDIKPYAKNAKQHSKKQIEQVAASIKRFGMVQPLVVDKNNNLIIGHCRFESAKLLGLKELPVVKADNLTDKEIKALRLADNKLNESEWEMDLVIEELKGLDSGLIDLIGFDKDLKFDIDFDDISDNSEREKEFKNMSVTCPKCENIFNIKI